MIVIMKRSIKRLPKRTQEELAVLQELQGLTEEHDYQCHFAVLRHPASADPEHPAKFYMVSAPAHCAYETRLIKMADANHRPLGSVETCNKRTINQFIHPDVLKTCQLSMGMTELDPGSNWNTMPSHTHEQQYGKTDRLQCGL